MSAPVDLLNELRARGVELRVLDDRLRFRPVDRVTPDMLARLRKHKPTLLTVLRADGQAAARPDGADPDDPAVQALPGEAERLGAGRKLARESKATVATESSRFGWIEGAALAQLPEAIRGLVCWRDGWTPASWAAYLRRRADRCDDAHADASERYLEAARLLCLGENQLDSISPM